MEIIIIIFTCQPSHEYPCRHNPQLLRGLSDSTQRRMFPLHYFEDQTAYRLLQLMMILFQCFIDFPMCVIYHNVNLLLTISPVLMALS